jgi:acetate kinase
MEESIIGDPECRHLLVVNCGSATVKTKLYRFDAGRLDEITATNSGVEDGYEGAVRRALAALPAHPDAIAHRVVHGGGKFSAATLVTAATLRELREVTPLAPVHNGPAVAGIEVTLGAAPAVVALFDTSFHESMPEVARRYGIPDFPGVRRYGFHGWSHRWVTERYAALADSPEPTIITLHLGGGSSAAAIRRGRSVDTSMGYSPLEGIVMATRPGDLDPGIITHLLSDGMTIDRLADMLNHECGLRAVAGTGDMQELLQRRDAAAELAVELYCYRVLKYVGAYLAVLEGAEALVFTGGIGERSPEIRRRVCGRLRWAGLELDASRNERGGDRISADGSRLTAWVIPTDEERLIARETVRFLGWEGG